MFSDWFKNDFFDEVELVCGPWLGRLFGRLVLVRLTTVLHDDSVRFDSINSGRIPKYSSIGPFFRSLFPNSKSEKIKIFLNNSTERKTHRKPNEKQFFHSKLLFWLIEIWHQPIRGVVMRGRAKWWLKQWLMWEFSFFINSENKVGDRLFFCDSENSD